MNNKILGPVTSVKIIGISKIINENCLNIVERIEIMNIDISVIYLFIY